MKFTDQQLQEIVRGARAFRTIPYPGAPPESAIMVAVRNLTEAELDACRLEAMAKLRAFCETRKWDPTTVVDMDPSLLLRYQDREIVLWAFYDPDTTARERPERFFPTIRDVEMLDATTLARLRLSYDEHSEWVSPMRRMETKEVEELVTSLGNASSASAELSRFERSTLVRLCISLASALRSTTSQTNR